MITNKIFINPIFSIFLLWVFFAITSTLSAQNTGLVPENSDGFEKGDWRNFRPHYVGNSSDWIRPQFNINDSNPIAGRYSLQWQGSDEEHEWIKVSNAFYLGIPVHVTMDFRVQAAKPDWSVGLLFMETFDRYTGIRITPGNNGRLTASLLDLTKPVLSTNMTDEQLLRLSIMRTGPDEVRAQVIDIKTGQTLIDLEGFSSVSPKALGIYVYTGSDSETIIDFDNISVDSAPYYMDSGTFVRSPNFVVLPRQPDMEQDQGNWVGAQSTMKKDERYLMWYRLRDNRQRGRGYGFAESKDGIHWRKFDDNPVFTYDPDKYSSSEKISVLHVDGLYRAWYAVNVPGTEYETHVTPGSWYTAYATSKDGKDWEQHGVVIDDTYTKDGVAIYIDDMYYLYSIRDNDKIGIHTSDDGIEWELKNTIPMGVHRHIAATYVERTGEFHLYTSGGFAGVSRAVSKDGIQFGPFQQVMEASKVGLDDWADAGVTYLSFLTDAYGKVKDDRELPFYYQARNTWNNNIPGWLYHGGEKVVLAGKYEGLFIGLNTTVLPNGQYKYHSFPFEVPRANGIDIHASQEVEIYLKAWQPEADVLGEGQLKTPRPKTGHSGQVNTQVQWHIKYLEPGTRYELELDSQKVAQKLADYQGKVMLTAITSGENGSIPFKIRRIHD